MTKKATTETPNVRAAVILANLIAAETATPESKGFIRGESVFIRTLTYHATGKVETIVDNYVVLSEAAWIADSGRFTQAIDDGQLNEVEPVKSCIRINLTNIVDVFTWSHPLPRTQK